MITHVVNLTLDAEEFLSSAELLEGVPELLQAKFDFFDAFLEIIGLKFDIRPAVTAGDCNVFLDVSDSFRNFVSTLRAGNIQ